jgi:phage regulator Rha-like protein
MLWAAAALRREKMVKKKKNTLLSIRIETVIRTIRDERAILDTDLARIYGIPTYRLNEAVKRNRDRFPDDFMFQLTKEEQISLTSQIAMSKSGRGGRRTLPYAFTEHGAVMAANILNSPRAVQMSIFVVRAFIKMRETLTTNKVLVEKLRELEEKLTQRLDTHEQAIVYVLGELRKLMEPPQMPEPKKRPIGFGREAE